MNIEILSLIGILLSVVVYITLIYKGFNVYVLSIVASAIVALFSGSNVVDMLKTSFMGSFVGFAKNYFLIFITSAIFGKLVAEAGIANSIAKAIANLAKKSKKNKILFAALSVPAINAILTYSGISLFVAIFTLMVIAHSLFKELDIPWHLYGFGVLGSATFTMGMLPGSPAIQNLLPMKYFGTTPMAAPLLGVVMSVIQIVLSLIYCRYAVNKCIKNDEHYLDTGKDIEAYFDTVGVEEEKATHPLWKCFIPLAIPFIVMIGLKQDAVVALSAACVVTYILFRKHIKHPQKAINDGALSSIVPLASICCAVGFGGVVGAVPGFSMIVSALTAIPGSGELHLVLAIAVFSTITASSSAGATIALDALADKYLPLVNVEVAHRLSASAGFGGLSPHSGGVFSAVSIIKVKHKDIYPHYFVIGLVIPGIVCFIALFLAKLGLQ